MKINTLLEKTTIIPVITLHDIKHAIPLAKALLAGGISTLEITLRTPIALEVITLLKKSMPECTIGAGTVTEITQLHDIHSAQADFAVSPALAIDLVQTAKTLDLPYLPGVFTPSEVLLAKRLGLSVLKFYPADAAGGIGMLKNFSSVFPTIQFCPTGGIHRENFKDYLRLPNVLSVGGSWLAPQELIQHEKWDTITHLAQAASEEKISCQ